MIGRDLELKQLRRERPRSRLPGGSLLILGVLALYAWFFSGEFQASDLFAERRLANASRFLAQVRPYPLHEKPFDLAVATDWAAKLMDEGGQDAVLTTFAISVAAIVLAGFGAAVLCLPGARNFASPEPFLPAMHPAGAARRWAWRALVALVRVFLIFARAIPEYIWAFLLIKIFGFSAWPAVLALALHNTGILGKLMAETVENVEPDAPAGLRRLGASRAQLALVGIFPVVFPRFLLYFFYRWETCVREATVLGMLGVLSLGSLIRDARASNFYDEMVFYVLLGAALVMLGDLASAVSRAVLRRAP
jgi:phosphonate transport system permease protein